MAYFDQERKAKMAPKIKAICAKYGIKGRLGVHHHSTVVLNISEGCIDFIKNWAGVVAKSPHLQRDRMNLSPTHLDVNPHWFHEHFEGKALACLKELMAVLNEGNHDRTDITTDYFDVGWYVDVNIGKWDKPYRLTA